MAIAAVCSHLHGVAASEFYLNKGLSLCLDLENGLEGGSAHAVLQGPCMQIRVNGSVQHLERPLSSASDSFGKGFAVVCCVAGGPVLCTRMGSASSNDRPSVGRSDRRGTAAHLCSAAVGLACDAGRYTLSAKKDTAHKLTTLRSGGSQKNQNAPKPPAAEARRRASNVAVCSIAAAQARIVLSRCLLCPLWTLRTATNRVGCNRNEHTPTMAPSDGKVIRSLQRKAKKAAKDTGKDEATLLAEMLAEAGLEEEVPDEVAETKGPKEFSNTAAGTAPEDDSRTVSAVLSSHPLSRDIHVDQFTLLFHGHELLMDAKLELNHGRCVPVSHP